MFTTRTPRRVYKLSEILGPLSPLAAKTNGGICQADSAVKHLTDSPFVRGSVREANYSRTAINKARNSVRLAILQFLFSCSLITLTSAFVNATLRVSPSWPAKESATKESNIARWRLFATLRSRSSHAFQLPNPCFDFQKRSWLYDLMAWARALKNIVCFLDF